MLVPYGPLIVAIVLGTSRTLPEPVAMFLITLAMAWFVCSLILVPALLFRAESPGSSTDDPGDGSGGPREPPSRDPGPAGIPLPDAEQATERVRDHVRRKRRCRGDGRRASSIRRRLRESTASASLRRASAPRPPASISSPTARSLPRTAHPPSSARSRCAGPQYQNDGSSAKPCVWVTSSSRQFATDLCGYARIPWIGELGIMEWPWLRCSQKSRTAGVDGWLIAAPPPGRFWSADSHGESVLMPSGGDRERARLAAIVESLGVSVVSLDSDGVIETWNAGSEDLYGYAAGEVIGRPVTILDVPGLTHDGEHLGAALAGQIVDVETAACRRDGSRVEVELTLSPIRDSAGAVIGVACLTRDVSGRKRSERELARLAEAAEYGTDAVLSIDLDGRVRHWNHGAESLYGYSAEEAIGRELRELTLLTDVNEHIERSEVARPPTSTRPSAGVRTARSSRF